MFFGVGVGEVGCDEVAKQAEDPARPEPKAGDDGEECHQPEKAGEKLPVVELSDAGKNQAQNTCQDRIAHLSIHLRRAIRTRTRVCSDDESSRRSEKPREAEAAVTCARPTAGTFAN